MALKITTSWPTTLIYLAMLLFSVAMSSTSFAAGCTSNCLSVYSNKITDYGTSVRGTVKLTDETGTGAGARGTVVHAIWTRPDGSSFDQYANIGTRLRASFSLYTAGAPGNYELTVVGATKAGYTFDSTNSSLLTTSISIGDTGNEPPTVVLNASTISGTVPLTVKFDSYGSSDVDGVIAGYSWNFGDGASSTDNFSTSHTYTRIGNFNAKLTETDNAGAKASQTIAIAVAGSTAGCLNNCLSVDRIEVGYRKRANKVKGSVWLVDEKGGAINGAKVHAVWTLPNGSSVDQYRKTKNQSKASFGLVADLPGKYVLTVTEVIMPNYSFDVDNSNVLTGQIDIAP